MRLNMFINIKHTNSYDIGISYDKQYIVQGINLISTMTVLILEK